MSGLAPFLGGLNPFCEPALDISFNPADAVRAEPHVLWKLAVTLPTPEGGVGGITDPVFDYLLSKDADWCRLRNFM